jgi:putative drug exporter of the RND superfamily
MFQQMGFGVAVALLIDATIIRSVALPSAMSLLGDRNWYLPRWLDWLPQLRVEGASPDRGAEPRPVLGS